MCSVGASDCPQSASLDEPALFISRLRGIRDWLQQNSRLAPVVDEFIGQQIAASEKRNTRRNLTIAAVTTVAGALLDWLFSSLATPSNLLSQVSQFFGRKYSGDWENLPHSALGG